MRRPEFTMTPEDLDKYDHDGTGDEGLRITIKRAKVVGLASEHRSLFGQQVNYRAMYPELFGNPDQPGQTDQPSGLNRG
jgi:hypothetical protein